MRVRKGRHHHPLDFSWSGGWAPKGVGGDLNSAEQLRQCFSLIFTTDTELGVFTTDLLSLLLLLLLPDKVVSAFFCSHEILVTETCSRTSFVARLKSHWLRPKMTSLMSRKPCLVLFLWGPRYPIWLHFYKCIGFLLDLVWTRVFLTKCNFK